MLSVAAVGLVLHLLTAGNYGIFRDELYYLDCANHLAFGYVDQPPLSILMLKVSTLVFGNSVWAIRLLPALAGALLVVLSGLLASRLGGGRFAVLMASLIVLTVPVYLVNTGFFSMNAFDLVLWVSLYLLVAQIAATGNRRLWLWFGLLFGLAMLNKIGVLALGLGLFPALLLTGQWQQLKSRQLWFGVLIAILVFLPHIIWQIAEDWPTAEFIHNATSGKIAAMSLPKYFLSQILLMNPILFLFWITGLGILLFWPPLKRFRILGLLWVFCFLFYGLQNSKPYYLSPAYPPLFAAVAVAAEQWLKNRRRWLRPALVVLILGGGLLVAPLAFPFLPPAELVAYTTRLGIDPQADERTSPTKLPQYLADRFGWENLADSAAAVYYRLPDSLRAGCVIVGSNYGEAGAINYYGPKLGLPRAVSQHNNYFLWGVDSTAGEVVLTIGHSTDDLKQVFDSVAVMATVESEWAMPEEAHCQIHLCTGLKYPFEEIWNNGKVFD